MPKSALSIQINTLYALNGNGGGAELDFGVLPIINMYTC